MILFNDGDKNHAFASSFEQAKHRSLCGYHQSFCGAAIGVTRGCTVVLYHPRDQLILTCVKLAAERGRSRTTAPGDFKSLMLP